MRVTALSFVLIAALLAAILVLAAGCGGGGNDNPSVFKDKGCTPNPPGTAPTKAWSADDSWYVILHPPRQLDVWDTQYTFPVKGFPAPTAVKALAFYRDASTSTSLLATIEQDGVYLRDLWPWGTPTATDMGDAGSYQYIRIMADGSGGLKIVLSVNGNGVDAEIPIPDGVLATSK